MKKAILFSAVSLFCLASMAQLRTPAPSPAQTIRQDFGIGSIELNYSRPGVKDRKVFGNVVPFGKVWRTGANTATTITFSDSVTIGGKGVKAGKYGLVTIPNEKEWTIIITKDLNVTSPTAYKQENDVLRYTAPVSKLDDKEETFTMQFANVTNNSIELELSWDKTKVSLPITTNTDDKVMSQIENNLIKDNRPYFQAAQYYYDNGKDMTLAMQWVNKALETNTRAPWMHLLRARIALKQGDKATAKAAAEKALAVATEIKNDDYVRMSKEFLAGL
ncbi:MAG: hypothetical protein K0Q66_2242 [Chitinophagaceae bacterium]|nr:hypothetical protein [Chitinophagaceae bacterium]